MHGLTADEVRALIGVHRLLTRWDANDENYDYGAHDAAAKGAEGISQFLYETDAMEVLRGDESDSEGILLQWYGD